MHEMKTTLLGFEAWFANTNGSHTSMVCKYLRVVVSCIQEPHQHQQRFEVTGSNAQVDVGVCSGCGIPHRIGGGPVEIDERF